MLLSSVAARTAKERTPLAVWVGVGLLISAFAFTALASGLTDEITDLTENLPEAFAGLMGGAGSNYVLSEMFGLIAPIVILVIAISGGVAAIAREERTRTADLLFTAPVTRREVTISKAVVLIGNLALACGLFAVGAMAAAALIDLEGFDPGDALAGVVHLFFLGLAFAMIALAAGNVTGSTSVALAITVGLAVASNLVAGLLPLAAGLEDGARLSPWYYFNGSDPLANGIDVGHVAVLAVLAGIGLVIAVVAVEARDLGGGSRRRLRLELRAIGMILRPHVATPLTKTLSERSTMMIVVGGSMAAFSISMAAMYNGLAASLAEISDQLGSSVMDLLGTGDMSTPEGWIQAEMLSIVVPFVLIGMAVVLGVRAIAGEADDGTLALIMTTPTRRSRLVSGHAAAIVVVVAVVAAMILLGLIAGSALAGLGIAPARLAASLAHLALLGILFGFVALAIGAGSSRTTAVRASMIVALVAYLGYWLLGLSDATADFAVLSPWYYAADAQPLYNGVDWLHLTILATSAALAFAAARYRFERREIAA